MSQKRKRQGGKEIERQKTEVERGKGSKKRKIAKSEMYNYTQRKREIIIMGQTMQIVKIIGT